MQPLRLLHRDERLVAVDKPAGLLSVPDPSAGERAVPELLAEQGLMAASVHRLDREVSGVLLLALDDEALHALQELFRVREVEKIYWGMAAGLLEPRDGQLAFPILEEAGGARVSARGKPAHAGHPLVGERKYARGREVHPDLVLAARQEGELELARRTVALQRAI
ncbi:MAG: hypothetical protein HOP15_15680, partial [Planctomycetes bacterium]|nr:hypothetical protein [Planctomycetota bacterium]